MKLPNVRAEEGMIVRTRVPREVGNGTNMKVPRQARGIIVRVHESTVDVEFEVDRGELTPPIPCEKWSLEPD